MSKNSGTTQTTAETNYPSFQLPAVKDMISEAQRLYATGGPQLFPGTRIARFNPLEAQGQAQTVATAQGPLQGLSDSATNAAQFNLGAGRDVASNPYFQGSLSAAIRPIREQLLEQVLPSIRNQALTGGSYGGSRQGIAEGLATKGAINAAQDATAQLSSQEYNNAQQRALSTMGQLPTLTQTALAPGQVLSGVGETQRGMAQAELSEQAGDYEYYQKLPFQNLAEFANYVRSPYGSAATSQVIAPQASGLQQAIGAGLTVPAIIKWLKDSGLIP
jgi:hypothetical protein